MHEVKFKYWCKKCRKEFYVALGRLDMIECPNCGAKGYNISPVNSGSKKSGSKK